LHKRIFLPLSLAALIVTPTLASSSAAAVKASLGGQAELTDAGSGTASVRFEVSQYTDGTLRGQMDFHFQDASGREVEASLTPGSETAGFKGRLSVNGSMALYDGPATISVKGQDRRAAKMVLILTDRHTGSTPAEGRGDTVWMLISPDDGSQGFSFSGKVKRGDIACSRLGS
jgi:hypothetical protein